MPLFSRMQVRGGLSLALVLCSAMSYGAGAVIREIDSGPLKGKQDGKTAIFKGIPYAKPPLGELRWRAPEPPAEWAEPRDANEFGPECVQVLGTGMLGAIVAGDDASKK